MWHCAAGFSHISGAMCSLKFNFASARIKCLLAFARKHLPQFRVSILWKIYEGRSSLETQLKIEFLLPYAGSTKVLENIPELDNLTCSKFLVRLHGEYNTSLALSKHHVNLSLQSFRFLRSDLPSCWNKFEKTCL